MKKIAIIGGGVAGTTALWALSKTQGVEVTLFEAEDYLGGHAYTHQLNVEDKNIFVDMGVEYLHERLSPNLFALLSLLDVPTYIAPLSFCAFKAENPTEIYWSNNRLGGTLNRKLNEEMNRFHLDMQSLIQNDSATFKGMSIKEFLDKKKYSSDFQQEALLPLMTTFSGCRAPSLEYSLLYVALSFNMNLLSFFTPCHWRKVSGGIHQYLKKMEQKLKKHIRLNHPVKNVKKLKSGVQITLRDNQTFIFDEVIFACQAEIAHQLVENPTKEQKVLLNSFESIKVQSILHSDINLANQSPFAKEYFQFELAKEPSPDFSGFLTRVNKQLYPYQDLGKSLFVSFDNIEQINPEHIITTRHWKLPKLRPIDLLRKSKIRNIQGLNNFWYCGTDYSLTGHECAMVSGLVIACHLGAQYPFPNNWLALSQFNTIKKFMGIYSRLEKVSEKLNTSMFNVSKRMNLHKRLAHHFVKELLF